jgi:hypothetical protein
MRDARLPMECLWRAAQISEAQTARGFPVLDVIYLCLGSGVLALMALYAYACERL